jgi:hypothetical protein
MWFFGDLSGCLWFRLKNEQRKAAGGDTAVAPYLQGLAKDGDAYRSRQHQGRLIFIG